MESINFSDMRNFDTLSGAVNTLNTEGFTEDFQAKENDVYGIYSKQTFAPEDLRIVETYRYEGMSNPQDNTVIFAIESKSGVKGTLIMSYSSKHDHNLDTIKRIPTT